MAEVSLKADVREGIGKGAARRTRREGRVPAVVYGHGAEPLPIAVDRREFVSALHTDAGMNVLLNLEIDGQPVLTLTKELQRDPVRGTVLHADFVRIDRTEEVEVEVPIHLVGEATGVKEGGVLEHPLVAVHVRARATDVPQSVDADVSGLGVGDSLRIGDLSEARTYQILDDPELVVASVVPPISEEQLEAMVEGVAGPAVEPTEVIEEEADQEAAGEKPPADAVEPAEG